MDLWGGKFSGGIEHHPEDPSQVPSAKIESSRSFDKIQSAAEKVPYEVALLAESHCPWHCFDPFFAFDLQVNGFSRMGLGNHAGHRSPWLDDEIQVVTSINETKCLQVPYQSDSSDCRHFDPVDWSHDC